MSATQGGHSTLDSGGDGLGYRPRDRLVEMTHTNREEMAEDVFVRPTESYHVGLARPSNSNYEAEHRPQMDPRQHRTTLDQVHEQSPMRRPSTPDHPAAKRVASRSRPEDRPLPQSLTDLLSHTPPKESRRGSHDLLKHMASSIEAGTTSSIDAGYATVQAQKPQTPPNPPTMQSSDKPIPTRTPNSQTRRPDHAQLAAEAAESRNRMPQYQSQSQRDAQRYGMFHGNTRRNSIDALFVGDDEDEAVEVPGMQEVHEQEKEAEPKTVSLGKSILGAPKRPPNSTGVAPVAPMLHNSPVAKKGEGERRGQ